MRYRNKRSRRERSFGEGVALQPEIEALESRWLLSGADPGQNWPPPSAPVHTFTPHAEGASNASDGASQVHHGASPFTPAELAAPVNLDQQTAASEQILLSTLDPELTFQLLLPANTNSITLQLSPLDATSNAETHIDFADQNGNLIASAVRAAGMGSRATTVTVGTQGDSYIYFKISVPGDANAGANAAVDYAHSRNAFSIGVTINSATSTQGNSAGGSASSASAPAAAGGLTVQSGSVGQGQVISSTASVFVSFLTDPGGPVAASSSPGGAVDGAAAQGGVPVISSTPAPVAGPQSVVSTTSGPVPGPFAPSGSGLSEPGGISSTGSLPTLTLKVSGGLMRDETVVHVIDPLEVASGPGQFGGVIPLVNAASQDGDASIGPGPVVTISVDAGGRLRLIRTARQENDANGRRVVFADGKSRRRGDLPTQSQGEVFTPYQDEELFDDRGADAKVGLQQEPISTSRPNAATVEAVQEQRTEAAINALFGELDQADSASKLWQTPVLLGLTAVLGLGLHLPEISDRLKKSVQTTKPKQK